MVVFADVINLDFPPDGREEGMINVRADKRTLVDAGIQGIDLQGIAAIVSLDLDQARP